MTIDEVLSYFGHRQSKVAEALGLHRQAVQLWWKTKKIPYDKQCVIQVLTNGVLKASKEE